MNAVLITCCARYCEGYRRYSFEFGIISNSSEGNRLNGTFKAGYRDVFSKPRSLYLYLQDLQQLFSGFVPQFPHLLNGNNDVLTFYGCCED